MITSTRFHSWLLLGLLLLGLNACDAPRRDNQVRVIAEQFFQSLQQQHYEDALKLMSDKAIANLSHEGWLDHLRKQQQQWGTIKSWAVRDMQVNTIYRGRLSMLKVVVRYQKKVRTEWLTLFEPVDDSSLSIAAYGLEPRN